MSRRVVNKNTTSLIVPKELFTRDFINLPESDARKASLGTIVISNATGNESLYILNTAGNVVQVGKSSSAVINGEVMDAINNIVIPELEEHVDNVVDDKMGDAIAEYNEIVVSSANTLYNNIKDYVDSEIEIVEGEITTTDDRITTEKEYLLGIISGLTEELNYLREYIDNLKFSDHVLIKENAYASLASDGYAYIDEDGNLLTEEDHGYGDEKYYVEWSPDVYYCIPEDGTGPSPEPGPDSGSSIEISGDTVYVYEESYFDENEHSLVLDDSISINEDNHAIEIISGDSEQDEGAYIGDDNDIALDGETEINDESRTTLELSNSFYIDNNTLIIS